MKFIFSNREKDPKLLKLHNFSLFYGGRMVIQAYFELFNFLEMQSAIELFEIIFENFQKKGQLGKVK